jgi:hypothetical protein
MLEDLWPDIGEFDEVNIRIEEKKQLQSQSNEGEETGSVQFAKKRAEKLRLKEAKERESREQNESEQNIEENLPTHDWLVE